MTAILFEGDRAVELDDLAERPIRLRKSMLLWVDLRDPSAESVGRVADELGLDDDTAARLESSSGATYFRDVGPYIHVTVSAPRADDDDAVSSIDCVVSQDWVVTSHSQPAAVLEEYAALTRGTGRTGDLDGPSFLAGLIEWVLNEHASAFERVEERPRGARCEGNEGRA